MSNANQTPMNSLSQDQLAN